MAGRSGAGKNYGRQCLFFQKKRQHVREASTNIRHSRAIVFQPIVVAMAEGHV